MTGGTHMFTRLTNRTIRRYVSLLIIQLFAVSQLPFAQAAVPEKVMYNEKYGRTRESFDGTRGKMVVHIQDAHCVYEAQKNIVGIVRDLYKNHNVRLITVEGADAYFNADELSSFPIQSVKDDVAEYFLKNGRISGAEYLLIQGDIPVALRGAENRDLYIENYNSFLQAMPQPGDTVMTAIDNIEVALANLKTFMLDAEMQELDAHYQEHAMGSMDFIDYATYLIDKSLENDITMDDLPNIVILMQSQDMENAIDFAQIHLEVRELIDVMAAQIDRDQLSQVLNKNLFYKIGKMPAYTFFTYLKDVCAVNNISIEPYANLVTYCDYLAKYDSIDDVAIAMETTELENRLKDVLLSDPLQKELIDVSHDALLLEKLMGMKVSKYELQRFQAHKEQFNEQRFIAFLKKTVPSYNVPFDFEYDYSVIGQKLPLVDTFYKVAAKRNEALIENTLAEMELEDSNIAVLITGGFHTLGITELLKEEDVSYRVISPSITEQPQANFYLTRLMGMPTDMENILTANNLQIPLVLADPAIIPDVAAQQAFKDAFKMLMEAHPDAANLEQVLAEKPTGYTPTLTFTDAFMVDDVRYMAFNLEGQKRYMAVAPEAGTAITGAMTTDIGNYTVALITEDQFHAQAQSPNRRVIETQTDVGGLIESALVRGEQIDVSAHTNKDSFKAMLDKQLIVQEADGTFAPTLGFMLNSTLSALMVKPVVAQVGGLDARTREVLERNKVKRIEVYSNQTDLTADDVQELNDQLAELLTNKRITLTDGKVVNALLDKETGLLQLYSTATAQFKPHLVINNQIFDAMLPQVPGVKVTSALQSARQGYISIDALTRTVTLYELNEEGQRSPVGDPTVLPPNITSADVLGAVVDMRRRAEEGGIGLIGYGNPDAGFSIAFENLDELLASVEDSPQVRTFTNVHRLLSVVPTFQDMDLTGKTDFNTLMDYLLSLMPDPKTDQDKVTCAAAAAALLHNVVKLDGVPVKLLDVQRKWLLARMLPLIDQRMKGTIPLNLETKEPEYSMYAIQQSYAILGQTSQALSTDLNGLKTLLETLPIGESVVVHLQIANRRHFIAIRSTDQGFQVQDLAMNKYKEISPMRQLNLMGLDAIIERYSRAFSGNILVSEQISGLTPALLDQLVAQGTMRPLDIDEQLATTGATGMNLDTSLFRQANTSLPMDYTNHIINLMRESTPAQAAVGGYTLQVAAQRPAWRYLMTQPDDDEPIEMQLLEWYFDVTFDPATGEMQIMVKEVVEGQASYLTMSPTGEIIRQPAPSAQELADMNMTLEQWEQQNVVRLNRAQIAELFGEEMAEEVGRYGAKIEGLTEETVEQHVLDIIERLRTSFMAGLYTPQTHLVRVTGYVKNADDFQPEIARHVDMYNRYTELTLNELRKALQSLNLEHGDMLRIVRQGAFELDGQGNISAVPERLLELLAAIQNTTPQALTQEGIYHELVEKALTGYRDGALIGEVADRLSPTSKDILAQRFAAEYTANRDFQGINDIVRETIAKMYTHRMIPDTTSMFFASDQSVMVVNEIDAVLNEIAPEFFSVVNPTTDSPDANIDRIIEQMNTELSVPVSQTIKNVVRDKTEQQYVNSVLSAELIAAVRALNNRVAQIGIDGILREAGDISPRIKADMALARERAQQDLSVIPQITAINATFFETEDGINDSRTFGITQRILESVGDPSKRFIIYSLDQDDDAIRAVLSSKGIMPEMVTIISSDTFKNFITRDPAAAYRPANPENILTMPQIVQELLQIEGVELKMMDFSILDDNPDVVQIALDNMASVFEVPQGFDETQLVENENIETGISALDLVEMLEQMGEPNATLPEDLIVTQVSAEANKFLHTPFEALKKENGTNEVTIKQLLEKIGLTSLSKEDLRGVRVKRKVPVDKGFIQKLQAQRALDTSA